MNDSAHHAGGSSPKPAPADPWEVFGARVHKARIAAGLVPGQVTMREVCSAAMLTDVERGQAGDICRALASFLDQRLNTKGALLDAWARALLTATLTDRAPVDRLLFQAAHIGDFSPLTPPEFFHTRDYAAALAPDPAPQPELRTKGTLLTHHSSARLSLITTETALRRIVGSPATTREQLRELRRLVTTQPRIRLHVLPDSARCQPGWRGPFRVLTFSTHHHIAHQPHSIGPGTLITDADHLSGYTALLALLQSEALGHDASLALLEEAIAALPTPPRALEAAPTHTSHHLPTPAAAR